MRKCLFLAALAAGVACTGHREPSPTGLPSAGEIATVFAPSALPGGVKCRVVIGGDEIHTGGNRGAPTRANGGFTSEVV